jgi:PAS domain S-box-containing protein
MGDDSQFERLRAELGRLVPGHDGSERFAELLGVFLANIPDFIVLLAVDGTILFLNRARPGKTVAEIVGRKLFEYMPQDAGRMRAAVERVVATGDPITLESSATYTDGEVHHFITRLAPVLEEDRVVAVASIASDITAQKQAAVALRDSEERLRLAVAATGMGLWSWDATQDVITWDDAMCRIWGVTPDTVPRDRESYLQTIHPEDRERQRALIGEVLRTGEYPVVEHRVMRPDGTIRRTVAKASVTRRADGSVEKLVGGVLDITEQRELEDRSRQAQKLAALGQLSAGVAHNFNNMLMAILPNIDLAMSDVSAQSAEFLHAARDAAERSAELVRQLMMFSRQRPPSERRTTDVRALVERTVDMCRPVFDHRIQLSVRCSGPRLLVESEETQLQQALLNLLINARDAVLDTPVEPKRVIVEVDAAAPALGRDNRRKYVCIRVIDNGVGMDRATIGRAYDPFFTTKGVGKGTGLGLSTALATVEEHGGILECESTKGEGTTFSVFLPAVEHVERLGTPAADTRLLRGAETILVVDDEAAIRTVTRQMLESAGYVVHVAASGPQALALLSDDAFLEQVDLVLLDVLMPGMQGDAVRAELRTRAPQLKVAYFSGYAQDLASDVVGIVTKPTSYESLLSSVRGFLDQPGDGR